MSFRNLIRPGTMLLAAGLLPLAGSQVRAQATSLTSLLTSNVVVLPSNPVNDNNDNNFDMFGDFTVEENDPLGALAVTSLSHAGAGISSGWLVGGTLGATAGLAGLVAGHGSSALQLRTPSSTPGLPAAAGFSNSAGVSSGIGVTASGFTGTGVNSLTPLSTPTGKGTSTSLSVTTPEPGSMALLGGLGLMLTAVKMRRRKR